MFNGQTLYDRQMRVKMDSMGTADKSSSLPLPSKITFLANIKFNYMYKIIITTYVRPELFPGKLDLSCTLQLLDNNGLGVDSGQFVFWMLTIKTTHRTDLGINVFDGLIGLLCLDFLRKQNDLDLLEEELNWLQDFSLHDNSTLSEKKFVYLFSSRGP